MSTNRFTNVIVREQLEAKNIVSASLITQFLNTQNLSSSNVSITNLSVTNLISNNINANYINSNGVVSSNGFLDLFSNSVAENTSFNISFNYTADPIGGNLWIGGILAPNGKIYFIPYNASRVLVIDTVTNQVDTSIVVPSGANKWFGGAIAPNQKIYCAPHNSDSVLIIDTITNTVDTTSIKVSTGNSKYVGAVLHTNGLIYFIPHHATDVMIINPATNTADTTTITGLSTALAKWYNGTLGTDGKIYCSNLFINSVLIIDPQSAITSISFTTASYNSVNRTLTCTGPSVSFLTQLSVGDNVIITNTLGQKFTGYVNNVIDNNNVVFIFNIGASVGTISTIQRTRLADFTTITGLPFQLAYASSCLAQTGNIYIIPWNANNINIINPNSTRTALTIPGGTTITYNNPTRQITSSPAYNFSTTGGVTVGDTITITNNVNAQFVGYVQSISGASNDTMTLEFELGTVGTITALQRSKIANVTTLSNVANNTTTKYYGATLSRNGKIYCGRYNVSNTLVIDPLTNTTITINEPNTLQNTGVLAPNNNIYYCPLADNVIRVLKTGQPVLPSWPLSAYFNKY